jgi:Domain of Unknown Function (DUF1080)
MRSNNLIWCCLPTVVAAAVFVGAGSAPAADFKKEKFDDSKAISLFDGKTLEGWTVSAKTGHSATSKQTSGGTWKVTDEAITGTQDVPGNGGIILTNKSFKDFEVIVEMKNDFGPDSGLFLRSNDVGQAYQFMVDYHSEGNLGGVYGEGLTGGIHHRNFSFLSDVKQITKNDDPFPLQFEPADWPALWKHGEWNELRARIVNNPPTITTWVNGVRMMEFTDTEARHQGEGQIALQVHGGGDYTNQFVRYKNIRVKPIE